MSMLVMLVLVGLCGVVLASNYKMSKNINGNVSRETLNRTVEALTEYTIINDRKMKEMDLRYDNLMNKHEKTLEVMNNMSKEINEIKIRCNKLTHTCSELQNEVVELRDENRRIVNELKNYKLISPNFTLNKPFIAKVIK